MFVAEFKFVDNSFTVIFQCVVASLVIIITLIFYLVRNHRLKLKNLVFDETTGGLKHRHSKLEYRHTSITSLDETVRRQLHHTVGTNQKTQIPQLTKFGASGGKQFQTREMDDGFFRHGSLSRSFAKKRAKKQKRSSEEDMVKEVGSSEEILGKKITPFRLGKSLIWRIKRNIRAYARNDTEQKKKTFELWSSKKNLDVIDDDDQEYYTTNYDLVNDKKSDKEEGVHSKAPLFNKSDKF